MSTDREEQARLLEMAGREIERLTWRVNNLSAENRNGARAMRASYDSIVGMKDKAEAKLAELEAQLKAEREQTLIWAHMQTDREAELVTENRRLRKACINQSHEIEQTLGRALGYPRYADDQENFPGATGDDVCVGEHVAETLAIEIARRFTEEVEGRKRTQASLPSTQVLGPLRKMSEEEKMKMFIEMWPKREVKE
jgi:hypothetical protein